MWARNGGDWASRAAVQTIVALKSSTWWAFLVVVLAIGCVAYADSRVEDVSLGYLYILPLSFSAILLSARLTYAIVIVCIFFHDLFGPPIHHIQGRILHNLAALVGFTFVVVILRWFVAQRNALNELTRHQRDELLKEVELAAEVQRLFLPRSDPETAGFEISGAMHPARVVGGDYYDYLPRPDGRMRLVIADVSGKGVAAALLMSATAAAVQLETNEPRKVVRRCQPPEQGAVCPAGRREICHGAAWRTRSTFRRVEIHQLRAQPGVATSRGRRDRHCGCTLRARRWE